MDRDLPPSLKLCNCAACGVRLLSPDQRDRIARCKPGSLARRLPYLAGRLEGRPYCQACLEEGLPPQDENA